MSSANLLSSVGSISGKDSKLFASGWGDGLLAGSVDISSTIGLSNDGVKCRRPRLPALLRAEGEVYCESLEALLMREVPSYM
jgi:hypothetical protein